MKALTWWRHINRYEQVLLLLFVLSLPLVNPWVRGDGVGYYAYARALIVNHNLQFEQDWLRGNPSFRMGRVDSEGRIRGDQFTETGHLVNHFAIGAALLWMPFLAITHAIVLVANQFGSSIPADGYSWPYVDTMAIVTACAGFAGLIISFRLARRYFPERWAFLATLGIWLASSLPVYMYFNPSWSHAQSAFAVALFLWYWDRTRHKRTAPQWFLLGLMAGFMVDMYYPNAVVLTVLAIELVLGMAQRIRSAMATVSAKDLIRTVAPFLLALALSFSPTLITRWLIYGSPFTTGYEAGLWRITAPQWGRVLFSSDHGLFSWTPILLLACAGLAFFWTKNHLLGLGLMVSLGVFYFMIAIYSDWDGISSYGNRFFVSLTPVFVLGLAGLFAAYENLLRKRKAALLSAGAVMTLLIAWNLGLIFQWGMQLIPDRGPISWAQMVSNQFRVVPADFSQSVAHYLVERHALMEQIEKKDLRQLGAEDPPVKAPTCNR